MASQSQCMLMAGARSVSCARSGRTDCGRLERRAANPHHRDGADFAPVQGGRAQEYVDISSALDVAMGQNRPAPKGLPWKAPWQRRSACTGNQPALRAAPPHGAFQGNPGGADLLHAALERSHALARISSVTGNPAQKSGNQPSELADGKVAVRPRLPCNREEARAGIVTIDMAAGS